MKRPGARCDECPLNDRPFVPCKPGSVMVVGEAPGYDEAKKGEPFVGESGQLLRQALTYAGFGKDELGFTNVVPCHPKGNKLPPKAVSCCSLDVPPPWFAVGAVAAKAMCGLSLQEAREQGFATWHPAYVLRQPYALHDFVWEISRFYRRVHGESRTLDIKYTVVQSEEQLAKLDLLQGTVCIDLETEDLRWYTSQILSIGIGQGSHAYIIPQELVENVHVIEALRRLFDRCLVVGHNVTFDTKFLRRLGVENAHFDFDTLLAHYVLNENTPRDLKTLSAAYCDAPDYEGRLVKANKRKKDSYSVLPGAVLYEYNAYDVCYNYLLWTILERELKAEGLYGKPFLYPLMASVPALIRLEEGGMPVDLEALDVLSGELAERADDVAQQMFDLCGHELNLMSWKQVAVVLYKEFRLPKISGRGFEAGSTNVHACTELKARLSEGKVRTWITLLGDYRSLVKMRSSYVKNLVPYRGHVYPSYRLDGAESGRMSATGPAIQTIPRSGTGEVAGVTWGERVRGSYVAPGGWKFVGVDYGQAELRVAAFLSQDPSMLEAYEAGRDLHSETATALFGPDFTKEQRQIAKNFGFASIYSFSEHAFPVPEGMSKNQTLTLVRMFHRLRQGLVTWQKGQVKKMHRQHYVETLTGRRRRFPLITRVNQDEAAKSAINMPVQGTASDLTLMSFIEVDEWLQESRVPARVAALIHDEILLLVRDDYIDLVGYEVRKIMLSVAETWVPMPWQVDIEVGQDWGHMKEVT